MVPEDCLYTEQHEWIKVADGVGTIGISDYAQQQLGDITFVELPEPDDELESGDELCAIESAKAAASVYAPAGGVVVEVNEALEDSPELVNSDPFGDGWIAKIRLTDEGELDDLLDPVKYEKLVEQETQ